MEGVGLPTIVTATCYRTLEKSLLYHFRNPQLLEEALRHRSFVNEHPETVGRDNERLEFLGDAVLNLVVSHVLMQTFPDMTEGDLSRTRAHMVNETYLAQVARTLSLGPCIQLGRGEAMTGGMISLRFCRIHWRRLSPPSIWMAGFKPYSTSLATGWTSRSKPWEHRLKSPTIKAGCRNGCKRTANRFLSIAW